MNNPTPRFPLYIAAALLIGVWLGSKLPNIISTKSPAADKLSELLDIIDDKYVDNVNLDSLVDESIPALLANLDPHTAYIPAKDFENVNSELEGSFSGIGISFQLINDSITVVEVISGGPSEKVGLQPGDRIISVDNHNVAGHKIQSDSVKSLLRGSKGTKVKLQIKRNSSEQPLSYDITRGDIPITSIDASYLIEPKVGYIKVNKFGRNTFKEFFTALMMLKSDGARSFIIDLRGNSGGYLDVAIQMANEFLEAGDEIVSTRGRGGELQQQVIADGKGTFRSEPLTLIIDEFSASASEILAGAMQDNDRARIVGRRSFGKGLVQEQHNLADGSAIRVTTARYYTPSGRCIQKPFTKGNKDDYELEVYDRYLSGEAFNVDSIKLDKSLLYHTRAGREVYGGGGIMPDCFVPTDTTNITSYYSQVVNGGQLLRYAFEHADANRTLLNNATSVDELLNMLPADNALLGDFVNYAAAHGVPARWYYIGISRPVILNQLKALIARDVLGSAAYYEVANTRDPAITAALKEHTTTTAAKRGPATKR